MLKYSAAMSVVLPVVFTVPKTTTHIKYDWLASVPFGICRTDAPSPSCYPSMDWSHYTYPD